MINRVVRAPSDKEKADAESRNKNAWWPQIGSWFVSKKGDTFVKLDMFPDQLYMLSKPQTPAQEVDQTDEMGI